MLAPDFLPVWGGVGTYIIELVRHLPKSMEIHVVAPSRRCLGRTGVKTSDYDFNDYFQQNVHVHLVSSASDTFVYNAAFQCACFRFVPRLVKEEKIDLIHSHTAHMPDLLLRLRKLGVPTATTIHTTISGQRHGSKASGADFSGLDFSEKATYLSYPVLRLVEKLFFAPGRPYITVSNWMKAQILEQFPKIQPSDVRVIHNSVDTEYFSPIKECDPNLVLFTGRLIAAKGLTYLIKAIPTILSDHPQALFVFIGPGDPMPYETALKRLGVDSRRYKFLGYLRHRKDILEYYRRCAVFVAPTLYENLPIRVLEAMACSKPVVATAVCAIPEVITSQREGILVPPKSSRALSEAVSSLLANQKMRKEMGHRARSRILAEFDWTLSAERTTDFYEEIVSSRKL